MPPKLGKTPTVRAAGKAVESPSREPKADDLINRKQTSQFLQDMKNKE